MVFESLKSFDSQSMKDIIDSLTAGSAGQTIEEYRIHKEFSEKIRNESDNYINKPSSEWPEINITWDLAQESQRFSLDCIQQDQFNQSYPNGFCLGYVTLKDFDKVLCHFSRRDEGELWQVGDASKLAYLIVYLSKGHPISPVLASPCTEIANEIILKGGHHRYAIAKEIGITDLPIHVAPEDKDTIGNIVSINWMEENK